MTNNTGLSQKHPSVMSLSFNNSSQAFIFQHFMLMLRLLAVSDAFLVKLFWGLCIDLRFIFPFLKRIHLDQIMLPNKLRRPVDRSLLQRILFPACSNFSADCSDRIVCLVACSPCGCRDVNDWTIG